jgi:hypothetical protein
MKYPLIPAIVAALIIISCGQNKKEQPAEEITVSEHYSWTPSMDDSTMELKMVENTPIPDDSLNLSYIIHFLNERFSYGGQPLMTIEFVKQSNDTVFIRIPNADYLTQQSGSTGAEEHLGTIVYNLTEVPGIHIVHADFEAGDHAQPGFYKRDSTMTKIEQVANSK